MKRLTARIDNGLRDYDEICFINPDDPEGAYNLDEIVIHGNYETKLAIAERLAEYEDTGLTPEQVQKLNAKQTPKKPILGNVSEKGKITNTYYFCYICDYLLSRSCHEYCPGCGQAIDWD